VAKESGTTINRGNENSCRINCLLVKNVEGIMFEFLMIIRKIKA
jgi:hypothetical protein